MFHDCGFALIDNPQAVGPALQGGCQADPRQDGNVKLGAREARLNDDEEDWLETLNVCEYIWIKPPKPNDKYGSWWLFERRDKSELEISTLKLTFLQLKIYSKTNITLYLIPNKCK